MTKTFVTGKGVTVKLGRELGRGGEGSVYEVTTNSSQVCKLYSRIPDANKQAKLSFMAASVDKQLLDYTAWPLETLHAITNGPVIGFLMPKIMGRAPIHMLYSPAHRRQDYPKATWDFLLFAARNTAAAFSALHTHGHVLGDVNQGNVLVGGDSKVVLIDCDSFQINANGKMNLCEVGVSHFTPPELQGMSSFHGIKRSFNHDNFGLALLIFHILFGGRHPYSGVPLQKHVGEALENDIKALRYAYSKDAKSRGIGPPPMSIPIWLVPDSIQSMFEVAFTERGSTGGRPTAQQWMLTLDAVRGHLKKCGTTSMHIYPDHLPRCPWCALEDKGIIYFIDVGLSFINTTNGFMLSRVWATIEAISTPPSIIIPNIATISVVPQPLPPGVNGGGLIVFFRILVVCIAIGMFAAAPHLWFVIAAGAWFFWGVAGNVGQDERSAERHKRRSAVEEARNEFNAIMGRYRKECGPERFATKKQELVRARDEYQRLPSSEKDEIEKLRTTASSRQKQQFLDRFFIDSADIPGVGAAKKAALRSFGIETAADVEQRKVMAVRGFGAVLTRAVVNWKKSCESRFVFNPLNAVSEADKNAVRNKIAAQKRAVEAALSAGAMDLQRLRQETSSRTKLLNPSLISAARKLAQAEADFKLF